MRREPSIPVQVASVEEQVWDDLVVLNTSDRNALVLTVDDYIAIYQRIARSMEVPLRQVRLADLTLSLGKNGIPELSTESPSVNHERDRSMTSTLTSEARPWGRFEVLETGSTHQVKRLEVLPGRRLSYQTHRFRSEHWHVISGSGSALLNGNLIGLLPGVSVDVAIGIAHRIENTGDEVLVIIEVQRGSYLGEDDIVRLDDDFGRVIPSERGPQQAEPGQRAGGATCFVRRQRDLYERLIPRLQSIGHQDQQAAR